MAADITSDLVLLAKCNEPSGTAMIDSTGLHANGTYSGSMTTVAAPTQFGPSEVARVFGTQDGSFANAADLQSSANFTIAAWVNTVSTATSWVYTNPESGFTTGHEFGMTGGSHLSTTRPSGIDYQPGTPDFNNGVWRHVISVFKTTTGILQVFNYIDGALVTTSGTIAWTPSSNSDVHRVGSRRGSGKFDGAIYQLRHYRRAFTAEDAAALFAYTDYAPGGNPIGPSRPSIANANIPASFSPMAVPLALRGFR